MKMVRATILKAGIDNILWPEVVLAMTNVKPTQALKRSISLAKMQDQIISNFQHFYVLGSTVYIFLHKKKRILISAK